MIRRNVAGQTVYFPQLQLAADGSAVTSSATLTVSKDGSEASSAGTLTHSANGVWRYTPTQAETDAAVVGLVLTATGAVPVVLNLVTTAANTQDATTFGISGIALPDSRVIYVSKSGNDANAGTNPNAPKLTIASALSVASAGMCIRIGAGEWTETNLNLIDGIAIEADAGSLFTNSSANPTFRDNGVACTFDANIRGRYLGTSTGPLFDLTAASRAFIKTESTRGPVVNNSNANAIVQWQADQIMALAASELAATFTNGAITLNAKSATVLGTSVSLLSLSATRAAIVIDAVNISGSNSRVVNLGATACTVFAQVKMAGNVAGSTSILRSDSSVAHNITMSDSSAGSLGFLAVGTFGIVVIENSLGRFSVTAPSQVIANRISWASSSTITGSTGSVLVSGCSGNLTISNCGARVVNHTGRISCNTAGDTFVVGGVIEVDQADASTITVDETTAVTLVVAGAFTRRPIARVTLVDTTTTNTDMLTAASVRSAVGLASANLDTQFTNIPTAVWSAGTRTLSSFGTLVSDVATAVWGAATRTLTAVSDSAGVTTLLSRIVGTLASGTHSPQSGDSFARLGAPAGASIAADIGTRLATSGYTAPPTTAQIADAVWDEAQSGHTTAGTFGSYLDAAVSGVSTGGVSASEIADAVRTNLTTELGRIDVAVSSRLASGSYTAPANADIAAIKAKTDALPSFPTNFASLAINASGHVLIQDNSLTAAKIASDAITAAKVAADVGTEIASAVRVNLATELGRIDVASSTLATAASVGSINTAITIIDDFLDTEVAAIKNVTDKLDTTMELDGAVYRFTTNSLERAPTGGGGSVSAGGIQAHTSVRRRTAELTPIYFTFPTGSLPNSAFTKTKRINGGSSSDIVGTITYLYARDGMQWYSLAYNAADRPASGEQGVVQYSISDGDDAVSIELLVSDIAVAEVSVLPATANGPKRVTANTIPLFVGERLSTPVPVFDANGNAVTLTGRTLLLKIETQQRNAVMSVTPTINGNTFVFTPSAEVTQSARVLIWALWDVTAQAIIATGEMPVSYAPQR